MTRELIVSIMCFLLLIFGWELLWENYLGHPFILTFMILWATIPGIVIVWVFNRNKGGEKE